MEFARYSVNVIVAHTQVIVATTIAETSITIGGVVYVVDCCLVKLPFFNPLTGEESLIITLESQAAAEQRAGRAGRVQPGKCFRLTTEKLFYDLLPKSTIPDIQRTNLVWIVLQIRALGIRDVLNFDYISPPSVEVRHWDADTDAQGTCSGIRNALCAWCAR